MATIKKTRDKCWQDLGKKGNPCALLAGMSIDTVIMENSMEVPQLINRTTFDPAIPLLSIYPKEMQSPSQRDICIPMFTAASFTIAKTWKQPKFPSMEKENGKIYIHIHEMLFNYRKEEILLLGKHEWILLSEVGQTEKNKHYMISPIWTWNWRKIELIETESWLVFDRHCREGFLDTGVMWAPSQAEKK